MKIIHCSDFHICHPYQAGAWQGKRFFGCLNWLLNRRRQHDFVQLDLLYNYLKTAKPEIFIFTGDLTQLGQVSELEEAALFLKKITKLDIEVFYLPGNHDCYIKDRAAAKVVKELCAAYRSRQDDLSLVTRGGVELLLLSQSSPQSPWRSANGEMSLPQLHRLALLAESLPQAKTTLRLVAGHYPLSQKDGTTLKKSRCLKQATEVETLLGKLQIDLYLCGHIHSHFSYNHPDGYLQICAGSLTKENYFCEIDITAESWHWQFQKLT